jgi:hypothetical protein
LSAVAASSAVEVMMTLGFRAKMASAVVATCGSAEKVALLTR